MKVFIKKIIIFFLPLVMILLLIYFFLKQTGENFYSLDKIISSNKNFLIGYAYNDDNYNYLKWKSIIEYEKLDIWALGSSRVLQFRAKMFDSSFYNAGYTIKSINDFSPFLKSVPNEKYPDILIMGLDQWMFNENKDDLSFTKNENFWKNSFSYKPAPTTITSIVNDLYNEKYGLSIIFQRNSETDNINRIGLNALINNKGFKNDGSLDYGSQIQKLNNDSLNNHFKYSDTFKRIRDGNRLFQYGNVSNKQAFLKLKEFLKYCSENNIHVVGFLPPYANKVNQEMVETGKYNYLKTIYPRALNSFETYNFELWDLSNLNLYGSGDSETIDGFHGGEVTYLRMLIYMIENGSILKDYTDSENLRNDLKHRKNNFQVYE